jgi:hypothetical protein
VREDHALDLAVRVADRVRVRLRPQRAALAGGIGHVVAQRRKHHRRARAVFRARAIETEDALEEWCHTSGGELRVGKHRIAGRDIGQLRAPQALEGAVHRERLSARVIDDSASR